MKNKNIIIGISLLTCGLVAAIIPTTVMSLKATQTGTPKDLTSSIRASKPGVGETVSFLPNAVSKLYEMDDLINTYPQKATEIGELMPYNDEIANFPNHYNDNEYMRSLYEKYDAFRPTNNVLSWTSDLDAKSYKVIISQDSDLSYIEREYETSGDTTSVILDNPYTSTNYYWQVIATLKDESKAYSDVFNFEVANLPRTLKVSGLSNTRDIGGSVGHNSKRMKEGLVYRGNKLEGITESGEDEFKNQLGIKSEVDLRLVGEGTENFLNLPNYYHYPSPNDIYDNPTNNTFINYFGPDSLVPNFGEAVKVFADKDNYPVYFHCSVGRDRTGFLSFVLNALCGVDKEMILKEFMLSLYSVTGGYEKGNVVFYNRLMSYFNYFETNYEGSNLSEKVEKYLTDHTSVTHEDCENIRKILLGNIDTGFKPGKINNDPLTGLAKVTMRKFGESSVIKLVEPGTKLDNPHTVGNGAWYYGDKLWDFDVDTVQNDMYLDYISKEKCKVSVRYSGISLPEDIIEVDYEEELDFSIFEKEGYTFKVYDDSYNPIESLVVTDDVSINVVYKSISGYKPKANSRIIVMTGQSNAVGVGHYEYLPKTVDEDKINEINNGYDNVLMTGYSQARFIDGFQKVHADRYYETMGIAGTFGFEIGLADRLSKVFPDETTYIVKVAYGGLSLNFDFLSPSSMDYELEPGLDNTGRRDLDPVLEITRGWMYRLLESEVAKAIDAIAEMDNSIPMIEAFMWMQGESDAVFETSTNLYLNSFNNLMSDFTNRFKDNLSYKFKLYDAGIYETSGMWDHDAEINDIKKSRVDENNIYISTDERLTTLFEPIGSLIDTAHYDAGCYIDLGHMFADSYLEHTIKGYTHNAIEIEAPEKVTMKMGENYVMSGVKALFNGEECDAKIAYFARQHPTGSGDSQIVTAYFKVNEDNSFTPTKVGKTQLKISAYYNNEIRMIIIPVEVIE